MLRDYGIQTYGSFKSHKNIKVHSLALDAKLSIYKVRVSGCNWRLTNTSRMNKFQASLAVFEKFVGRFKSTLRQVFLTNLISDNTSLCDGRLYNKTTWR